MDIFAGVDPSLKRTGISVMDIENKKVYINKFEFKEPMRNLSFNGVLERAILVKKLVIEWLESLGKVDLVISETPPPMARFSSGLSILDGLLIDQLVERTGCKVLFLGAGYLSYLHRTKKYIKDDSMKLFENIKKVFEEKGYEIVTYYGLKKGLPKICHDEAESFIFLSRLVCRENIDNMRDDIVKVCDRLGDKKETSLLI